MRPRFPKVDADYYPMEGGLDLVTPPLKLKPGKVFDSQNYEPQAVGGYRRINGFERFDGHASPSDGSYWVLTATITGTITTGATLTGAMSGATGKVLSTSGTTIALGRVTGIYVTGEALQIAAVTQATATGGSVENGAASPSADADYRLLAANDLRIDILTVPGSGDIRGGFIYGDVCYVFRDNLGATAGALYKQTAAGWVQINFGKELQFTGATGQITDGQTVTGATSGATGVVVRAMLRSGTWTVAGAGTLIFATTTGTFTNGENIQVAAATKVVASGGSTAIARSVGGRVEAVEDNFTGATSTKRIYGADGVNLAFEFDGTNYIPIRTGMTSDVPSHVAVHKFRLFLSFSGSLQFSAAGQPYSWTPLTGANEIAMGDVITGLLPLTGSSTGASLGVFTSGRTSVLYGSSSNDFNLVPSADDLGFAAYTMQSVGNDAFGLTARGVQSVVTTLNYGDFEYAAISIQIQPLLMAKRGLQTASITLREKNQYRLYFSDGSALVFGLTGAKVNAILPLNYGMPVKCMWSATLSTGEEATFFGSTDGYVYQDNVGTSFDGEVIESWIRPVFNNLNSPLMRKQFRFARFDVTCDGYSEVNATYDLGYGTSDVSAAAVQDDQPIIGAGGYWDQLTWDHFTWDSAIVTTARLSIDGTETNISFLFQSSRAQDDPHVVSAVALLFTLRRLVHSGT